MIFDRKVIIKTNGGSRTLECLDFVSSAAVGLFCSLSSKTQQYTLLMVFDCFNACDAVFHIAHQCCTCRRACVTFLHVSYFVQCFLV